MCTHFISGFFVLINKNSTIRSISPGARSQRSHRPKLPSIDNDDWAEDNNERHGKPQRAVPAKQSRRNKNQVAKGYGAMNQREKIESKKRDSRKVKKDPHLDITRKLSNNMNQDDSSSYSESGSESDDDSCYSSDFTR